MSNSTQGSVSFNSSISGQSFAATGSVSTVPSGSQACKTVQSIATSSTQIVLEVTGSPAFLVLINNDTSNYVEIDANSSFNGFPQKILAGGFIVLSPETATIYAKANTGAILLTVLAVPA